MFFGFSLQGPSPLVWCLLLHTSMIFKYHLSSRQPLHIRTIVITRFDDNSNIHSANKCNPSYSLQLNLEEWHACATTKRKSKKAFLRRYPENIFFCIYKSLQVSPHVYTYMRKHVYVYIYIDTLYPSFCCFQLPMPWHKATPWRICTGTPSTLLTAANLGLDVSDGAMG